MSNINFKNDFKIILKKELDNNKITYKDTSNIMGFYIMYYDAIHRIPIVNNCKYDVIKSKELIKKFNTLPIETQECIKDIEQRLKLGKSITTYLSKSVLNAKTKDNELQNWNIYHAHVKKVSNDYNKFTERSDKLLFFTIKDNKVYFIDVKDHPKGSGWFNKELIEIIYDNWSELLKVINGALGLSQEVPEDKVHNLSKNIGLFIEIRGKVIAPTTLGNTTAGNSLNSTMWAQRWIKNLNDSEKQIKSDIKKIFGEKIGQLLNIHLLKTNDGKFIICETNYWIEINNKNIYLLYKLYNNLMLD